jgi:hypothetical protein
MNYLQLAQKLRVKCRAPGSGPSAVTGQTAEYTRLLSYINEAWMSIQRLHTDWMFLRASCSCTTLEGIYSYTASSFGISADFGYWALDPENGDTFRTYLTATGLPDEQLLGVMKYENWRNLYLLGANRTSYQRPGVVAAAPDRSLVVGPIPAAGYTIAGDYYRVPSELVAADDTPALPVQFHWAIVYRAMMFYGTSEAAPEIYDEGRTEFNRLIREIEAAQLPEITTAPPLC